MRLLVERPSSASSCRLSSSTTDRRVLGPLLTFDDDTGILLFFRVRKRGAICPWSYRRTRLLETKIKDNRDSVFENLMVERYHGFDPR
jgi:hypothetical protein